MKNLKIEFKWAVIFMIMMLLWMLIEKLAGLHDENIVKHAIYTNLVAIPAVAVYVLALLDKKNNFYDGNMSYMQGFKTGLIITVIVTIVSPLTQYITSTFITPDYFSNVTEFAVKEGKMTKEEALNFFNLKSYIMQGLIGAVVMGIITSAIVAYFIRSKN
ncbi:MAG: DUF4199 domain-containing protein [Ignavibacteria bacterium]|nr:DUF4199 domain-containing protein [Ignavibacteria bacterium]